jgi:glycosyltransferase involved in cell wall biosynthesis
MNQSITVMITTYNRNDCILELTRELKRLKPDCTIVVVDDCSDEPIDTTYIDRFFRFPENNGKRKWWLTCRKLWRMGTTTNSDLLIQMVDDCLPNEDFFEEAVRLWKSIEDRKKIALHLANNNRKRNWTNFDRVDHSDELYLTQTTETTCIAYPDFFRQTIKVHESRWKDNPKLGSGVFARLCQNWFNRGFTIYGVKKSLIRINPKADESQMNKDERKINKWIVK